MKTHPFIKKMLEGGKRVAWGAKTIPSGGYYSMPRSLSVPGMAIAGDAANMVNIPTLKGIHYAMHAGMYAAEAIFEALKAGLGQPRRLRRAGPQVADRERPVRVAQHAPAVLEGLLRRRRDRQRDDDHQGPLPRRQVEVRARHRDRDVATAAPASTTRSPTTSSPSTSSTRSSSRATRPATTRRTTSRSRATSRASSPRPGSTCARRRSTRSPTISSRTGPPQVDVHVTASNCVQCGAINAKGGRLTMPEGGDGPLYQEV